MPIHKTDPKYEVDSLYCPLCAKPMKDLQADGKIINHHGYIQCLNCHADMLTIEECLPHWERRIRAQDIAIQDLKIELVKQKSID